MLLAIVIVLLIIIVLTIVLGYYLTRSTIIDKAGGAWYLSAQIRIDPTTYGSVDQTFSFANLGTPSAYVTFASSENGMSNGKIVAKNETHMYPIVASSVMQDSVYLVTPDTNWRIVPQSNGSAIMSLTSSRSSNVLNFIVYRSLGVAKANPTTTPLK